MRLTDKEQEQQAWEELQEVLVYSAILLFAEKGYGEAHFEEIASRAGLTRASLYSVFDSKESVLFDVVGEVFIQLFHGAEELTPQTPRATRYALLVALAMHMAESSDTIKDTFIAAFSTPKTVKMLNIITGNELERVLAQYLVDANSCEDLYVINARTADLFAKYLTHPSAANYTTTQKINRFLNRALSQYCVPSDAQEEAIAFATSPDIAETTQKLLAEYFEAAKKQMENYEIIFKKANEAIEL